jgi:hypothetical protein
MDNAVALVQAYLNINGYFTVAEYPVVEAMRDGGYRTATDLDILAFRFPGSGRLVPGTGRGQDVIVAAPDVALAIGQDEADMLIGEVKEGRAELNQAGTDPAVLRAALMRFGCCPAEQVTHEVEALIRHGRAMTPRGHRIRLVAFGSTAPAGSHRHQVILLGHVVRFLRNYIAEHWDVLHAAEFRDPAFGFFMTVEKALRGLPAARGMEAASGVEHERHNVV